MQQPKMVVLGLIAQGVRYGFEMERFIDLKKMRLWVQIGKSTIYKALRDLQRSGDVSEKRESAARGPGKAVFSLTDSGKQTLDDLVSSALSSSESVYSDRIAGLVFAGALPGDRAVSEIEKSMERMKFAILAVDDELVAQNNNRAAKVVLDFYRKVYTAEREAMSEMKDILS